MSETTLSAMASKEQQVYPERSPHGKETCVPTSPRPAFKLLKIKLMLIGLWFPIPLVILFIPKPFEGHRLEQPHVKWFGHF